MDRARAIALYEQVIEEDALKVNFDEKSVDVVVLIELIEHLEPSEGEDLLRRAGSWARKKVIITTPNGFLPQGEIHGNPWQVHRSGWTIDNFQLHGMRVYGLAGYRCLHKVNEGDPTDGTTKFAATIRSPWWFTLPLSAISQIYTSRHPALAFELLAVWDQTNGLSDNH